MSDDKDASNTIGKIGCTFCGEDLPVRRNGRDTLNVSCPWCGVSAYAKPGTEAHRIITESLPKAETAPQQPAGKPSFFTKAAS